MSIGIGMIGTGVMGAEHARILQHETPGAHLAGIFDADAARGAAVASEAAVFSDPLIVNRVGSDRRDRDCIARRHTRYANTRSTTGFLRGRRDILAFEPFYLPVTVGIRGLTSFFCGLAASATVKGWARHIGAASERENVYSCTGGNGGDQIRIARVRAHWRLARP